MKKLFVKIIRIQLIWLLFAAGTAQLSAQVNIPGPPFEKVLSLRRTDSPVISPDGKAIVFRVRTTNWKKNAFHNELWLVREGEQPFQLTRTAEGGSSSPEWSYDGRWIAFLADRGEKQQIFVIRPDGGEAQPVTSVTEGIVGFHWSPVSNRIAFTMSEPEKKATKDRKERYGEFVVEDEEYLRSHLWTIDIDPDPWPGPEEIPCFEKPEKDEKNREGGEVAKEDTTGTCVQMPKPVQLTEGDDFTVDEFKWSPDGNLIAFAHRDDPLINSDITSDISIIDVTSRQIRPLVERPGVDADPLWSPDGEWIVFTTSDEDTTSHYYNTSHIVKVPSKGGKPVRIAENLDEDLFGLQWISSGLFGVAFNKTRSHLYKINPESGHVSIFGDTPQNIWSVSFSKDGNVAALSAQSPTHLQEIYRTRMSDFDPVPVTNMTRQLENWTLGTSEVISWKSQDGSVIEGVLRKPPDFDPSKKYPLLVVIHGGPTGIDYPSAVPAYVYPVMQWLAKGAVVLHPNYRGSTGYGEAFRSLNIRNLGVGDMWDVLSGVDYLVGQGFIDDNRMGAMGWSQGGYISAFLTTHTDRFAAISVGAGISNWVTYYVNTDIHPFTPQYLKATPWEDPEIYAVTSPMTKITEAATPTLIQHGELDRRVPIPNAFELYQGLKDVGVPTELIVYKGFGHGINKPKELLAATWHNWQWFARYIWGEEVALPLPLEESKATDEESKTTEEASKVTAE